MSIYTPNSKFNAHNSESDTSNMPFFPENASFFSADKINVETYEPSPYENLIYYVDGGCGTGKTYSTCMVIKEWRSFKNQMYVAPTKALLYQTAKQLEKQKVKATIICSENAAGCVASQIVNYLKGCRDKGEALLITWAAYCLLPFFSRRQNWNIYIDEIPQVDSFYDPLLPFNYRYLIDFLEIGEAVNETISRVHVRDAVGLRHHLERNSREDDVFKQFHDLMSDALSPHKDLFVDTASWNRVIENGEVSKQSDKNRILFLSMLKPGLFQGVTVLGANMRRSILYGWFTGYHRVNFSVNSLISRGLRPERDLSNRLRITYFFGRRWSKSLRDQRIDDDHTVMEMMESLVLPLVEEQPFLLVANNDYEGALSKLSNTVRLPVVSKGMNEYTDHNLIVHLPALNRKTSHVSMLNRLGIDSETISQSTGYEALYQNVMRTCLRDPDSTEIVDVIVPSKRESDFLITILGNQEVRQIGCSEFKTYKPLTQTDKNNRSKASGVNKRISSVASRLSGNGYHLSYNVKKNSTQKWELQESHRGYLFSWYPNKYENNTHNVLVFHYQSIKEFISDLKTWSKCPVKQKEKVPLISSCLYEPEGETYKQKERLIYASMMVLDFDSGTVSPEIFTDIFWNNAHRNSKRAFVLVNSFSRSPENPNRFRVFLPFTAPVTSLLEYQAVYDSIVDRLAQEGHPADLSGMDDNAKNGVQAFYVPCTNRLYPESRLFIQKGCSAKEIGTYAIDPSSYGRTALRKTERTVAVPVDGYGNMDEPTRTAKIDAIKAAYLAVPTGKGLRHNAFFVAASNLAKLIPLNEVENILCELAGDDRKMQKRIPDLLKSVKKKHH